MVCLQWGWQSRSCSILYDFRQLKAFGNQFRWRTVLSDYPTTTRGPGADVLGDRKEVNSGTNYYLT